MTGAAPEGGETISPLAEAGQQATESIGHLASRAADVGLKQADRGRQQAASGIEHVAESIRRLTTDIEVDQPAIANAADTAADQAERFASYLREHDAREILGNVESFARRQPLLFLGGAFLLGTAVSRFVKAAAGDRTSERTAVRSNAPYWHPVNQSSASSAYEATGPGTHSGNEGS
jgi:hypothetical protein